MNEKNLVVPRSALEQSSALSEKILYAHAMGRQAFRARVDTYSVGFDQCDMQVCAQDGEESHGDMQHDENLVT